MDLAERVKASRQAVSRWEVGAAVPGTDNLKVRAELYGVPGDYRFNDNTMQTPKSIPRMEKMYTSQEDGYSEGTFTIQ